MITQQVKKVKKVKNVMLWSNSMVMVFDVAGQQVAHLQGRLCEVREPVLDATGTPTEFSYGHWRGPVGTVTRDWFKAWPCSCDKHEVS